jgi:hypothetical protein
MLMVFDDEVVVGQSPIVGCLVMKEKTHIHKASCGERFHFQPRAPPQICMPISCSYLHGFQQFNLGCMHQKVIHEFFFNSIVIPSLPYN